MHTLRVLSLSALVSAYAQVVLGAVVRITGSGMGCGDDWPLCNGRLIPPFDDPATLIEYGHRLAAVAVGLLVAALALFSVLWRKRPGVRGVMVPALAALGIYFGLALLGAVTVWLELRAAAVLMHLAAALALLAVLLVAALNTRRADSPNRAGLTLRGGVLAALGLGLLAVFMGGVTANTHASGACLGFPLCSGRWWPRAEPGGYAHIQWTHRLLAYALVLHLAGLAVRARKALPAVRLAVWTAAGAAIIQVGVGAAMIYATLHPHWRATHAATGSALWLTLVWAAWQAVRGSARTGPS